VGERKPRWAETSVGASVSARLSRRRFTLGNKRPKRGMVDRNDPARDGNPLDRQRPVKSSGLVLPLVLRVQAESNGANRNACPIHLVGSLVRMCPSHYTQARVCFAQTGKVYPTITASNRYSRSWGMIDRRSKPRGGGFYLVKTNDAEIPSPAICIQAGYKMTIL